MQNSVEYEKKIKKLESKFAKIAEKFELSCLSSAADPTKETKIDYSLKKQMD